MKQQIDSGFIWKWHILGKDETMILSKTEVRLDGIREFYVMMMGDLAV